MGILLAAYPFTKGLYPPLLAMIESYSWLVPLIGCFCVLIGLQLISWVGSLLTKGHFETISGPLTISVERGLVQKIVQDYWRSRFQNSDLFCKATMRKNKLQIIAEIPVKLTSERLEEIRRDLKKELEHSLGYVTDFTLSII